MVYSKSINSTEKIMTPLTTQELRAAFSTRTGTPESVIAARAAAARRLRVGPFSPEAIARRSRRIARDREMDAVADAAERWFVENQASFTWLVGTNHDTPVASYLAGAPNVRLCEDPACCDGVLETHEQKLERMDAWERGSQAGGGRNFIPEWRW
jgi:hypothetical protein